MKAGEEALRSSASSEAITYFLEALQLYTEKYGIAANPEKLAAFEKNIAIAYFNKGQHQNAVHYFDKLFLRWRRRPPTSQASIMAKLAYDVSVAILRLRLPWLSRMQTPGQRVNEFFALATKKDRSLVLSNPRRCVTETIGEFRESFKYDLTKLDAAAAFHLSTGGMFSYAGFFRIADLVLEHAKNLVDEKRIPDLGCYQMVTTMHNYLAGKWTEIPEFDKSLFDAGTKNGLFWDMTAYSYFQGAAKVYQGKFTEALKLLENLFHLEDKYQFHTGGTRYGLLTESLLVRRRFSPAQTEANNLVSDAVERGLEPWRLQGLGWRGMIQVLTKDMTGAKEALTCAEQVRRKRAFWPPWILASSLLAQFMFDLLILEDAIGGDSRSLISEYTRAALKSGKRAVRNSTKFAAHRTWNYQLMGEYYWLIGNQRKALKWFDKSIKEGERLGARPDLSRTYMEVGKRLLEPHSKYKELNGVTANEYLEKAETMFREIDLQWDLDELERVRQRM